MRFAHLKRILKLGQLRLACPRGAQDELFLLPSLIESAAARIAGRSITTSSASVHRVTLSCVKRGGPAPQAAGLNERPNGLIRSSRLPQQNRHLAEFE